MVLEQLVTICKKEEEEGRGGGGTRRASSKGSGGTETGLGKANGTTRAQDPEPPGWVGQEGKSKQAGGEEEPRTKTDAEGRGALTHVKEVSGRTAIDGRVGVPGPSPSLPGLVQVLDVDIGGVIEELSAC